MDSISTIPDARPGSTTQGKKRPAIQCRFIVSPEKSWSRL
jgi:hypothetical protein